MLISTQLEADCLNIDTIIRDQIVDPSEKSDPVLDGIVDINSYLSSKVKIIWVLKEVNEISDHDEANSKYGGWDLRNELKKIKYEKGILPHWEKTFTSIVYATYGILNNCLWDDIAYLHENPDIVDVINQIAFINVKKLPGKATCNSKELSDAYNKDKNILFKQIDTYKPQVIIFGGTSNLFKSDLGLNAENERVFEYQRYWVSNNQLYIEAFHPASRSDKVTYVDSIIKIYQEYSKSLT